CKKWKPLQIINPLNVVGSRHEWLPARAIIRHVFPAVADQLAQPLVLVPADLRFSPLRASGDLPQVPNPFRDERSEEGVMEQAVHRSCAWEMALDDATRASSHCNQKVTLVRRCCVV